MVKIIKNYLKKNQLIMSIYDRIREMYFKYCISDEDLIKKQFKKKVGREVNLKNPIKFNDKLQWLKLNWYDFLAVKCSDKYRVRDYVGKKIGEKYLNELYGVYNSVEEINFDKLPKSFVLKATHGSGYNIICKNKNELNLIKETKKMKRWLKINYFWQSREWVYKDIKPRIIAEKYLKDRNSKPPNDYKIFCFNGEPKLIQVDFNKFIPIKRNLYEYDLGWKFIDAEIEFQNNPGVDITNLKNFKEMLELSKILSNDFPHVRVDFYNIDGKIYFGELTFFHGNGMRSSRPEKLKMKMGNWLKLPR
jgi:hypothetical protein